MLGRHLHIIEEEVVGSVHVNLVRRCFGAERNFFTCTLTFGQMRLEEHFTCRHVFLVKLDSLLDLVQTKSLLNNCF